MIFKHKSRKKTHSEFQQAKSLLNPLYVIVPVVVGLIAVFWMLMRDYQSLSLDSIDFSMSTLYYFLLAWLFMMGRDFGLTWRFRSLTDHDITWGQALRVNMLCEFTSAVTPSTVGGSSFGLIYLKGEGLRLGRSTTIMMSTLFLDELFLVVACPIAMLIFPFDQFFGNGPADFTATLKIAFWIVYCGLALWTAILFWGIFIKPQVLKIAFDKIFSLKILTRWHKAAIDMGDNIIVTARELRRKSFLWWLRAFFATSLSWISRYMVVNAIFLMFGIGADQLLVLVRQLVMWVVLTICPTPGGSGVSEWIFKNYYGDMIPVGSLAVVMALCWRLVSYYIYLIIGICVFPSWMRGWARRSRAARKESRNENNG